MSEWSGELGPEVLDVKVELYTADFRVSGQMPSRFRRVADILNLAGATHLVVHNATVAEYSDPDSNRGGEQLMVSVDAVLFGISWGVDDTASDEMRIPKRPAQTQIALPPFWLTGMVHVSPGSRPMDGLLNVAERFLPLTDVAVTSAQYPGFNRTAPVLAVQRNLSQILLVADDEAADQLLADILPEDTVRGWFPPEEPVER